MRIGQIYRAIQVKTAEVMSKHADVLRAATHNMPAFITVAPELVKSGIFAMIGICWEKDLRTDVANMARQKILKELTRMPEFEELIKDVEPALRDAISHTMAEISKMENDYAMSRSSFEKQQNKVIEMIEKEVWAALEPKIQDIEKKQRIREWIDNLKTQLSGVPEIQQKAAEVLREEVRQILYDFNDKAMDQLGQGIPGEIEGEGSDKAMHELAETIVEKIMNRDLDFDIAIRQVVAELSKEGIMDAAGREKLVADLLKASRSNDGTNLDQLFADFRKTYLDPGEGTLHLPKNVDMKPLEHSTGTTDKDSLKGVKTDDDTE